MSDNRNLPAEHRPQLPTDPPLAYPPHDEMPPETSGAQVLKRYAHAVWRRKWMVLLIVLIGTTAGILIRPYVPMQYVSEVTLIFQPPDVGAQMRGPIQPSEMLSGEAWISLLRSGTVMDHVAREQRLFLEYRSRDEDVLSTFRPDSVFATGDFVLKVDGSGRNMTLATDAGIAVETAPVGQPIGSQLGFLWTPPAQALESGRDVPFTVLTLREGANKLDNRLLPQLSQGGDFLTLQYTDDDPERAADVLNALADRYVEVAAELKGARITQLRAILETQLREAEIQLANAQRALESYRVATITQPSESSSPVAAGLEITSNPVLQSYFNLQIESEQIERDMRAIQRATSASDGVSVDALSVINSVRESPELSKALTDLATKRAEIRSLTEVYTPEHPEVRRAAASLDTLQRSIVPQLANSLVSEMQTRMNVLDELAQSTSTELRQIPTRSIEEARHRRDVAQAENIANDLRARYESARLGSEATVPDVAILDAATPPERPVSDEQGIQFALMSFGASLGLAALLAIMLDRMDPRLRYAEQVTQDLRLSIIGAVPTLNSGRQPDGGDNAEVIEAFRGIRLNLQHAYGTAGPMIFTITSPGSGDGKTFITSNLAIAFSDLGLRVLAIDGDTRRGQLHRLMQLQRVPGLTDYLAGTVSISEVLRPTSYKGVDVLPGGRRLANAPELLSSPRMGELLAATKPNYDVILIDSPPLGAGVDPLVLGTLSGNMLLVMRPGITDRSLAEAKLDMLDRLPIRILGTVLNGFEGSEHYRYYSYLPGYEATSEDEAPTRSLTPA